MTCKFNVCAKHFVAVFGVLGALSWIVSYLWAFILPANLQDFYQLLMQVSVLGYTGQNVLSFLLGLIEWTVCSAIFGAVLQWLFSLCGSSCGENHSHHSGHGETCE